MLQILPAKISGFTPRQQSKINDVIRRLNTFMELGFDDIEKMILDYNFTQTTETNGRILERFNSGAERGSRVDGIWQAQISAYYKRWSSAVARTFTNSQEIQMNMAKHSFTERAIVTTLIHEYCHLVGMTHTRRMTNDRDDSCPYAIGVQIAEMYMLFYYGIVTPTTAVHNGEQPRKRLSFFARVKRFIINLFKMLG